MNDDKNKKFQPQLGLLKKTLIALGGITSGLASGFFYINNKLRENLGHAFMVSAESNMAAAFTMLDDLKKDAPLLQSFTDSLPIPENAQGQLSHWNGMRRDLKTSSTVLGNGLFQASQTPTGEKALKEIRAGEAIVRDNIKFWSANPAPRTPAVEAEFMARHTKNFSEIQPTIIKNKEALIKETVSNIPLLNKVGMKDIHLTAGQKTVAGVVFAAVSSVVAYGLYQYMHPSLEQEKTSQSQR